MDMKKILQAFDGAAEKKPVQGASDMKKFVSIVRESASPYTPATEAVITSFEAGSVGGDANAFLLAADTIQDEVMAQVNKIKINADEASLRDMMDKFNAFMTAYHNVGKGILQPDMFNDSMGESTVGEAFGRKDAYQRDYDSSVSGMDNRQSQAYQDDGGANDERHDLDPSDWYVVKDGKMFKVSVYPNQEREAIARGYSRTRAEAKAKAVEQGVAEGSEYKSRHAHKQEQDKAYADYRTKHATSSMALMTRAEFAKDQRERAAKKKQGVAEGFGKFIAGRQVSTTLEKLLRRKKPEIFTEFGDKYVFNVISQVISGFEHNNNLEPTIDNMASYVVKSLERDKKQGVAEGSGPKEKQKTPYRDINSPEYRAAADKQKQRMAQDKAATPGKKLLAKQGVAEGLSFKDYVNLAEAGKSIK